jgi:hypothetical protein
MSSTIKVGAILLEEWEEESAAAATSVKETFDHLSFTPAEPVLA